ncbi:MAG: hypothetical protein U0361_14290 [Nitrospiraceae bacterium]
MHPSACGRGSLSAMMLVSPQVSKTPAHLPLRSVTASCDIEVGVLEEAT